MKRGMETGIRLVCKGRHSPRWLLCLESWKRESSTMCASVASARFLDPATYTSVVLLYPGKSNKEVISRTYILFTENCLSLCVALQ